MKKAITILLIVILLCTTILPNRVWAKDLESYNQIENGSVQKGDKKESIAMTDTKFSVIGSILSFILLQVPLVVQTGLTLAILPDVGTKVTMFTIEDLLFGRFELFDVDFMKISRHKEIDSPTYMASNTNVLIKQNVAKWFYTMRQFAIVALFAVLIAIGILMAISTIASDRAKYKKMLINWFASFVILMLLPYIMAFAMNVCDASVGIVRNIAESLHPNVQVDNPQIKQQAGLNFENTLLYGKVDENGHGFEGLFSKILKGNSWEGFALTVVYCVLVYYQAKFFFIYLKRMFSLGFLIVISPLITITYSIDKAGDNRAQAYTNWIKEFLVNLFIQPLHALLFLIFMYSVYGIMERAPLLAIVFLGALSRGEKLVRSIFKIENSVSVGKLRKK